MFCPKCKAREVKTKEYEMTHEQAGETETLEKVIIRVRRKVLRERLKIILENLEAAEALRDEDYLPDIRKAKRAICRAIRSLEPPLEGKR